MIVMLGLLALIIIIGVLAFTSMSQGVADGEAVRVATRKSLLDIKGFTPAIVHEGMAGQYGIALDPATQRFAISIPGSAARAYHFSQLVAVEIDKNGSAVTTTTGKVSTGSAAIATLVAGPVGGLLVGAKTSSTSTSTETIELTLKIFVDDLYSPCFAIPFGGGVNDGMSGFYGKAVEAIDAWYGRFRSILMSMEGRRPVGHNPDAIIHTAPAPAPIALGWAARNIGA